MHDGTFHRPGGTERSHGLSQAAGSMRLKLVPVHRAAPDAPRPAGIHFGVNVTPLLDRSNFQVHQLVYYISRHPYMVVPANRNQIREIPSFERFELEYRSPPGHGKETPPNVGYLGLLALRLSSPWPPEIKLGSLPALELTERHNEGSASGQICTLPQVSHLLQPRMLLMLFISHSELLALHRYWTRTNWSHNWRRILRGMDEIRHTHSNAKDGTLPEVRHLHVNRRHFSLSGTAHIDKCAAEISSAEPETKHGTLDWYLLRT
ncbi:hypothetical protein B0H11DRAFT_1909120 [Mycena galericulata]|nr:hypothetical protein B0H11DRAFT_1909120 [Mycena galericulata]